LAQFKPQKSLTFAEASCIKNEGIWDAILTIETAIHASGIPPLVVFLLEAKEIRALYRRGRRITLVLSGIVHHFGRGCAPPWDVVVSARYFIVFWCSARWSKPGGSFSPLDSR
jgi:hypothetical protein